MRIFTGSKCFDPEKPRARKGARRMCRMCGKREADYGGMCVRCESIKMDAELEGRKR